MGDVWQPDPNLAEKKLSEEKGVEGIWAYIFKDKTTDWKWGGGKGSESNGTQAFGLRIWVSRESPYKISSLR